MSYQQQPQYPQYGQQPPQPGGQMQYGQAQQYGQQPQYGMQPGAQMSPQPVGNFPYRIRLNMGIGDYIGAGILAFIVILITFGIAAIFYPYGVYKFFLNRVYLTDSSGAAVAKLEVDAGLGDQFVHFFLWVLLGFVTLGLAFFFWQLYAVPRFIWNRTSIVAIQPMMLPQ